MQVFFFYLLFTKKITSRKEKRKAPQTANALVLCTSSSLSTTENVTGCWSIFVCFIYSDIMMRDNLFEIVTTSRTFYVQVISLLNFGQARETAIVTAQQRCCFASQLVFNCREFRRERDLYCVSGRCIEGIFHVTARVMLIANKSIKQ